VAVGAENNTKSNFDFDSLNVCSIHHELTDIFTFPFYMVEIDNDRATLSAMFARMS